MSFLNEISKIIELPLEQIAAYKYTVVNDNCIYIAGHRGVKSFSTETAEFRIGKKTLRLNGVNLYIKHLSKDDAVVVGEIKSTEIDG